MLKINENQREIMAKYGIYLLKPEINTDKTTLISISKYNKKIKYKEDKNFTNVIITDRKTDLPLLEFSLNKNLFSIKKYVGDTENILEIVEIDKCSKNKKVNDRDEELIDRLIRGEDTRPDDIITL